MMPFTLSRHPFAGRAGILPEKAAVFRRFLDSRTKIRDEEMTGRYSL